MSIEFNNSRKSREIGMLKSTIQKKDAKIERLEAKAAALTKRIKELERERDEARAERDEQKRRAVALALQKLASAVGAPFADNPNEMREVLWEFMQQSGWVRLDDETIERVVEEFYAPDQGSLAGVLRDLRDGKLEE